MTLANFHFFTEAPFIFDVVCNYYTEAFTSAGINSLFISAMDVYYFYFSTFLGITLTVASF